MAPRLSSAELAAALGRRLGGRVHDLRRLSGGASRVTSAFELDNGDGARAPPHSADGPGRHGAQRPGADGGGPAARRGRRRRAGARRGRRWVSGDELGASWLVVERLEGETIPRKILRDDEWAAARRALTGQAGRALAAIHTIDPATIEGLAPADPLGDPLPFLDALGEVRPALELGVRWLAAHRPPARHRG